MRLRLGIIVVFFVCLMSSVSNADECEVIRESLRALNSEMTGDPRADDDLVEEMFGDLAYQSSIWNCFGTHVSYSGRWSVDVMKDDESGRYAYLWSLAMYMDKKEVNTFLLDSLERVHNRHMVEEAAEFVEKMLGEDAVLRYRRAWKDRQKYTYFADLLRDFEIVHIPRDDWRDNRILWSWAAKIYIVDVRVIIRAGWLYGMKCVPYVVLNGLSSDERLKIFSMCESFSRSSW